MAKNLLIVESPAKAKTINKYLGKDFMVLASYGHVRDLVPKEGAVDPDNNFKMRYELIEKNEKHVEALSKAAKVADTIYLATDPDREGEAISWHIAEILKERNLLKDKTLHRVVFTEITPKAIREAVDNPRKIAGPLVDAQQARRALDYLVGFNLSLADVTTAIRGHVVVSQSLLQLLSLAVLGLQFLVDVARKPA